MDFEKVLPIIVERFEKNKIQYALIGGFAMGLMGAPRATMDIDFLITKAAAGKIDEILTQLGYKCVYKSENVAQYTSGLKLFGEIDFLYAFRQISKEMLRRAKIVKTLNGKLDIRVLIPEDIIGLKIQAMTNNPDREAKERLDIEALLKNNSGELDWSLIKEYFFLFSKEEEFKMMKAKYGKSK
ncbi:MAG: nucleotidyltransferase [Elusimicrobia bacterium]|nr:nucleotidyltransferase [Elusimicrobiota bacterium]